MSFNHSLLRKTLLTCLIPAILGSCVIKDEAYDNHLNLLPDTANWPNSFNFGRVATDKEVDSINIDVSPNGTGLPVGSGTASKGKLIYAAKCSVCHGETGMEGPFNILVTPSLNLSKKVKNFPEKTIGNYWPYATTLYDYINRAMPYNTPGTLTPEEVYSLTAFLLNANGIIDSTLVLDANTLPQVVMPAQKLFVADDRKGGTEVK